MPDPSPATVERVAVAMRDEFARVDSGGLGREDWRLLARAAIAAMEEAAPCGICGCDFSQHSTATIATFRCLKCLSEHLYTRRRPVPEAAPTVPDAEKREPPYTSAQISDPRLHAYYESAHYPDSHRCYWCGRERSYHEFEAAPVDESEQRSFDVAWKVFAEHGRPSRAEHKAFNSGWLAMSRRSFSREKRLRDALGDIMEREAAGPSYEIARAALSEQEPASA